MQEKIEKACHLTLEELKHVVLSRKWAKAPHARATDISYTFDRSTIPLEIEKALREHYSGIKISTLSSDTADDVRKSLALWQSACDDHIDFHYKDTLTTNEPGITLIGCDNLGPDNGVTLVSPGQSLLFLNRVIVCIPSRIIRSFDQKTIAHEIGHALGIGHVHEVESIRERLMQTEQGQVCSVMSYNDMLKSPVSGCTITEYCADGHYTIIPSAMDRQICSYLYSPPPFLPEKYARAMCMGFLNGSMEKMIASFLEHLNFITINKEHARNISLILSAWLRANKNQPNGIGNALLVCELTAQMQAFQSVYLLHLIRTMANICFLFMQLYHLYASDKSYITALYLGTFLVCNGIGLMIAEPAGKLGAYAINKFVDGMGSLFSACSRSTRCLPAIKGFFSPSPRLFSPPACFIMPSPNQADLYSQTEDGPLPIRTSQHERNLAAPTP